MSEETEDRDVPSEPPREAPSEPTAELPAPPPTDPEVAMDDDSPATVRKTFIVLMTLGGILLLLPRQYVSAGILFAAALVVTGLHLRRRRSETSG